MSDDTQQPIVVKKIKKGGGGAHGGAWKIAYADFVTAMMAFFLLMWLLGSTAQGDLEGIADYFQNPLKLAMQGGEAIDGLLGRGGDDEIGRRHDSHGTASWLGNGSILRRATGGPPVPTQPAGTAGRQLLGLQLGHPGS